MLKGIEDTVVLLDDQIVKVQVPFLRMLGVT